ncbi:immunoglobulin I-set domain protein [Ancylostoma caninum]|uniref:Immunoglobulin I-set domain protein n=1 Tax=Ancylostoma caninum TaxID=29170 RepID=A0A368G3K6_ANCCA|nr:immunoglobulin I-set domain protein [Ancylostoma caninum]
MNLFQERKHIEVSRGEQREHDLRFIADDSEDGHHHSLTIISIETADAGEYGVIIDGTYTTVTKIVVTESEVFTQSIFEEPEVDVSLQMYSVKDDASVDVKEKLKTTLEKDVVEETKIIEKVSQTFTTQEEHLMENGFEVVDIKEFDGFTNGPLDEDVEKIEKVPHDEVEKWETEELHEEYVDEAAYEAAAAVAVAMTQKLFEDTYVELEQIQKTVEVVSHEQKEESGTTTPESEKFEQIADICIELPPSDEEVPSPEEKKPDEDTTLVDLGYEEQDFVKLLVEESIQEAMKEVTATLTEKPTILEEVKSEVTFEEEKIEVLQSLTEEPREEVIITFVPLPQEEAIASTVVFDQEEPLSSPSEFVTTQAEEVVVLLELDHDQPQMSVEQSIARPRKCKLTVFLTFDETCDVLPIQEVQLLVEFHQKPETEVTEIVFSQIMYEDDEASTIDDTLTSLSSSCLYTPPEFLSTLKEKYEFKENSRALFKVVVKGVPLPRVVWFLNDNIIKPEKNSVNIVYEDGVSFLEVCQCNERWNGTLTCEATNSAGTCKVQAEVLVIPEGEFSTVLAECFNLADSKPQELPVEIHLSSVPCQADAEFVLLCATRSDFDTATFIIGEQHPPETRSISPLEGSLSEASTSSLLGQSPAFIVTMPTQVYSKVNENIQLKCSFTGQPLPAVTWEKDGNLVDLNKRKLSKRICSGVAGVSSLKIGAVAEVAGFKEERELHFFRNYNIITEDGITILRLECTTLEDNALFSCTVANSFGMLTAHCKVIVEDDVLVHKHVGTRVICDRESEGAEVEAVMSSPSRIETKLSLQEGSREIESVDVLVEIEEETRKESIDGQAPYFLLPLEDGYFTSSKCVLKSIVMATPPAHVQWTVNDVHITEDLNHRVITEDGIAILQITNISSEELRITCTATNDYGEAVTKCHLSKRASEDSISERGQKPYFVLPLKDVDSYDDEVQLKCVVSGEPLPKMSWQLDGEKLEERYFSLSMRLFKGNSCT